MNMKAIVMGAFGGPEVLQPGERPLPQPHDDEVLVRIHAASVNPVDYKIRSGHYPAVKESDLPIVPGRDLSGSVESWGPRVHTLSKGDAVFAMVGRERGTYAQYAVAKATEFTAKPKNLDHVQAASVPLAGLTAWQGLFDHGALTAGEKVLIHGGAGGVGHFAIQFAKAKGATVAATCSKDDLDFVHGLGADQVIDYKSQRFEDSVSEVDLVYDLIGGETQTRSFAVLKRGGRLVSTLQEPDQALAAEKAIRGARYMAEPNAAELAEIRALIEQGKVTPHVSRTFPLAEAGAAQSFLEREHARGKVVLKIH